MLVKTVTIITQRTMFASQKSVKLVDAIRMLIGLTGIFANHTRQKVRNQMQIVIDIPDDDYRKVQDGRASVSMMRKAIRTGTPLPKEHGDLVDRNAINDRFYAILAELESLPNKPTHKEVLNKLSMCLDTAEPIIKHNYEEVEEKE